MKRYSLFLALVLLMAATPASACEFCQCLFGLNPLYSSTNTLALHTVWQRWTYDRTQDQGLSHSKAAVASSYTPPGLFHQDHGNGTTVESESRTTIELAYRHHVTPQLLAVAVLPYVVSTAVGDHTVTTTGIGDPMLLGYYVTRGDIASGVPATLLVGGGLTLPLGRYENADGSAMSSHAAPGSGAVDLLLNTTATMQTGGWTLGLDALGRISTPNRFDTRLGNSLTMSLSMNRDLLRNDEDQIALIGIAGGRGDIADNDKVEGIVDAESSRRVVFGMLGGQLVMRSWKFDFSVLLPLVRSGESAVHREASRFVVGGRLEL